jgi:DNA anti-recombination protein RmuC
LDDPRIKKLQELLEQATRLRDRTNQLIADLSEGLSRSQARHSSASAERLRKPTAHSSQSKKL